jgi:uncharacterized membrane protein
MSIRTALLAAAGLVATTAALAGPGFTVIAQNFEAWDVSADGSVVAGNFGGEGASYAYWTRDGGLVNIGGASPQPFGGHASISDDGRYIGGTAFNSMTNLGEMARYDRMTGQWTTLGGLGGDVDGSNSSGWGISGNGQSVVGLGWLPNFNAHAVQWTEGGGFMDLGSTVPGRASRANDVNHDGSVVVGWQDGDTRQAAVWRNGVQTLLFDAITNEALSEAEAVSGDGNWVGGFGNFGNNGEAWIWSEGTGTIRLGHINDTYTGAVTGLSEDGSVAIGFERSFGFGGGSLGFIWTEATGMVDLNAYAASLGIDTQGLILDLPLGISADGLTIVGRATDFSTFSTVGFVLTIPTPASAGVFAIAGLAAIRRRR